MNSTVCSENVISGFQLCVFTFCLDTSVIILTVWSVEIRDTIKHDTLIMFQMQIEPQEMESG